MNHSTTYIIPIIGGPTPESPSISRRTYDFIRTQINGLLDSKENDQEGLRKAASALELLPLLSAGGERWYGVRPDGDLLSFNLQTPYEEQEEEDLWKRSAVLMQASERYPELTPLVPPPPLSCRTCPRCGGTGTILRLGEPVQCICEGLGWLPVIEDEIEERRGEKEDTESR